MSSKQKLALFGILVVFIGLIWSINTGLFRSNEEGYAQMEIPDVVDFNFDIKPILSDKCFTCHGPDANQRKAGYRLDLEENAFAELPENKGKYGIVKGKPVESQVYQRIVSDDPAMVMPPSDSQLHLNEYEKKLIKKWIKQGAKYEKHWAFIPPTKKEISKKEENSWSNNEIDEFVLEKLEANTITPSKKADKETLARRISLDLRGLPPSPEEVSTYVSDTSSDATEKLIDKYLKSSQYGERMAQMWMDVSRYADSHGYQDDSYRTMWPWRDWVIHAFNENIPYNEFLTLQLAGDLLPNANKEQVLATAFNRNHPITQEGGVIQEEYRSNYVVDRTNTLGKGILGLTLECSKCHDHKYDPLSQKNYFEFYSFFNNVNEQGLRMDAVQAKNNKYFADAPYMTITKEEANGVLSFINIEEKDSINSINVMVMNDSVQREAFIFHRGEYDSPGEKVEPSTPDIILPFSENFPKNRLGLAQWTTDKNNPLTARVFVNRIWGMLFGNGLVVTAEDFGVQGSLPSHPKLLDWLAVDFMENGWDIKYLMKKIMLSATYQQSSKLTEELKKLDPENILLARGPRFRLDSEMIRDYMLTTSGLLNNKVGGPSVKPYQPDGLWAETTPGANRGILTKYIPDTGDKLYRRSLYTFWKRTLPPPGMSLFDAPNRDYCEVRRQKTNTPLQALALQNDVQMVEAARVLAQNVVAESKEDNTIVSNLFNRILLRQPSTDELGLIQGYYTDELKKLENEEERAKKLVAAGSYKKPETDIIKTAALMLTAQVIYNLDETITKE